MWLKCGTVKLQITVGVGLRIKWLNNRGPVLRTFFFKKKKEGSFLRNKFVLEFSQKERIQKCSLMLPLSITEHDVKNKHTNVNLQRHQYITTWIKMLHIPTLYLLATCILIEQVLYKFCAKYYWVVCTDQFNPKA